MGDTTGGFKRAKRSPWRGVAEMAEDTTATPFPAATSPSISSVPEASLRSFGTKPAWAQARWTVGIRPRVA